MTRRLLRFIVAVVCFAHASGVGGLRRSREQRGGLNSTARHLASSRPGASSATPSTPFRHLRARPDGLCRDWTETRPPWNETKLLPCDDKGTLLCKLGAYPLDGLLQDAWFSRGDTTRLDIFLRALERPSEEKHAIVVLGGSMTEGHNANTPWPGRFQMWLNRTYPLANVEVLNWGAGSTGSGIALNTRVPRLAGLGERLKLVIVDFGVNDAHYGVTDVVIASEQIMDIVLELPAKPALVYLETFRIGGNPGDAIHHCATDGAAVVSKLLCSTMYHVQDAHALSAVPKRVPIISYRDVVWPMLETPRFSAKGCCSGNTKDDTGKALWSNAVHPKDITHQLVTDVLTYALQERANELCLAPKKEPAVSVNKPSRTQTCDALNQPVDSAVQAIETEKRRRVWYSHGFGAWATRLDNVLARSAARSEPLEIGVIGGAFAASSGSWPAIFGTWCESMFGGHAHVRVRYLAPSADGLAAQDAPFAFNSSRSAADSVASLAAARDAGILSVNLVIVDLASTDALNDHVTEPEAYRAFKDIIEAVSRIAGKHVSSAPALLFLETYAAATPQRASQICEMRVGREVLKQDPRFCASFYYMHTTHAHAIVPKGVPLVSYRDVAWPIIDHPPTDSWWAAEDNANQPPNVKAQVGSILAMALADRAKAALNCDMLPVEALNTKDHATALTHEEARNDMFESEERAAGLCADGGLTTLAPELGTLEPGASSASAAWRYFEDRPGKPGWIYNGSAASVSETSTTETSLKASVKVRAAEPNLNLGFLKTYGCMGRVRVRLGTSAAPDCEIVLDGHWDDTVSLLQTTDFRPPASCLTGGERHGDVSMAQIYVTPEPGSDAHVPGCAGKVNKFKLAFIQAC